MKAPVEPRESAADERSIDEGLADADAGNLHDAADVFAQLRLKLGALRTPHDQGGPHAELLRRVEGFEDGTAKARQRMSSPISAPAGVAEDKCPG